MAFPGDLAQQLLICFHAELDAGPAPIPAEKVCLRAGETIPISAGTAENEACGLAWVRVTQVRPVRLAIQEQSADDMPTACGHSAWAVDLEMAVVRCLPYGTTASGPSCDDWTAAALLMDADAAAMRRASCCFEPIVSDTYALGGVTPGVWEPHGPEGGALWGTQLVTVILDCSEC
ncbi:MULTISPECIES: hypothetical protein [unclassified Streptomyces]|uniref:hypothetical protein n=1 Tax=unclassified Streptomyces TaxID=2593676 RepID=UPI00081F2FF3|nr:MULTISPECIES: hypothetical protein [unclassified Streptomyces]MYZ38433.1 hypothetical protein [Streptomyces sp. SID4917]SCF98444.1 hypothetical protein GA0115259_106345 [Streptomyces sp. MnatMP-M17]